MNDNEFKRLVYASWLEDDTIAKFDEHRVHELMPMFCSRYVRFRAMKRTLDKMCRTNLK